MWLPCVCEIENKYCDMVFYHPQDIIKGEKLAREIGQDGAVLAYKLCEECKFINRRYYE